METVILTTRQAAILDSIRAYIKQHSMPPSMAELADEHDINANAIFDHTKALVRRGAITKRAGVPRSIVPVKGIRVKISDEYIDLIARDEQLRSHDIDPESKVKK